MIWYIIIILGVLFFIQISRSKKKNAIDQSANSEKIKLSKAPEITDPAQPEKVTLTFKYPESSTNKNHYLFYAVETEWIPYRDADPKEIKEFPEIKSICWSLLDGQRNLIGYKEYPEKTDDQEDISGYANIESVLIDFAQDCKESYVCVTHNEKYNKKIVQSAFYRHNLKNPFVKKTMIDLMTRLTKWAGIPRYGSSGYKYPSFQELLSLTIYNNTSTISQTGELSTKLKAMAMPKIFFNAQDEGVIDEII